MHIVELVFISNSANKSTGRKNEKKTFKDVLIATRTNVIKYEKKK